VDTRNVDRRLTPRRWGDLGFSSVQFLMAAMLALIFFLALANVVVVQYAKGSMRSALDQGVRAGAISRSVDECERRISEVFEGLLSGTIGDTVGYECRLSGGAMSASGSLVVESWTPFTGDYPVIVEASATLEPDA
jgi:hypothetical protein